MVGTWEASDEALLAGFGTGDPTATAVFIRRFQTRVYGLAAAIVGDGPTAADVAQETFVRAWRNADAYDSRRGSVSTWLLAITRNRAIDVLRMEGARRADPIDHRALESLVSSDPAPDDAAIVDDDVSRTLVALRQLPQEQIRALLLASVGGRTAREIAEVEDIPIGTAKTRIRTALIRMRSSLRDVTEVDRD
jgi:RNA polymerase sigma-70 factor (ECF subfamily)